MGDLNLEDVWVGQREERQEPQPMGCRNLEGERHLVFLKPQFLERR